MLVVAPISYSLHGVAKIKLISRISTLRQLQFSFLYLFLDKLLQGDVKVYLIYRQTNKLFLVSILERKSFRQSQRL